MAVGPNVLWHLGATFAEALGCVVDGDGGSDRAEPADWLANRLPDGSAENPSEEGFSCGVRGGIDTINPPVPLTISGDLRLDERRE